MSTPTDFRQKVVRAIVWSATQNWGRMVILFLVLLVLSRLLEPEAFGLVAMATVFTAFAKTSLDQGFGPALVQRAKIEPGHLDTAFWAGLFTGGLLTLGGIAASAWIALFFGQPQLAPIVKWMSFSFLFGALSVTQQSILQRELAFKRLATSLIVADIAGGIAGISLALLGFGVWSLVAQTLVSDLTGATILWRVSGWRPGFHFSKTHFKELFTFGLNIVGARVVNFFKRRSDDLLIGYFLGPVALGYYTIAYQLLLTLTRLLLNVVNAVVLPTFSHLQNEPEQMREALYTATHYASLIAFPAFLGLSAMAPELIVAFYGPKWAPSVPVLQLLGLSGILLALFFFNSDIIVAAGKPGWSLILTASQALVSILVFAVAVRWGIVAVAAAYVIRGYLTAPISLWMLHKLIDVKLTDFLRRPAGQLVASLVMLSAVLGVKYLLGDWLNLYLLLVTGIGVGMVVYVVTVLLIKPKLFRQAVDLFQLIAPRLKWATDRQSI